MTEQYCHFEDCTRKGEFQYEADLTDMVFHYCEEHYYEMTTL